MSNNFEHKPLSQLCALLNGLAFKPEDWSEYGHPIIRIQNLNGSSDFNFCNRPVPNQYMIPPDTVLFSWSGNRDTSFGPYWWKGPSGVLNQHIFKVSPKPDIYPRWLYYSLDLARQEAEQQAHGGSGLVHVRRTDLLKYKIPTPPPPEQRCIAEILDTIDEAIQKTEALISKLKAMQQGLLHDLLTRGLDKNGKLRDPKAHPEQFKDSMLGKVPREWNVLSIGSLLSDRPKNGYSPKEVNEFFGCLILGLGCLTREGFRPIQIKNAPDKDLNLKKAMLQDGDLLVSRSNTRDLVGLPGTYRDVGFPCIYPDLMMRLKTNERCSSQFLELLLRHFIVRRQLTREARGTSGSMVKINSETIMSAMTCLPNKVEQQRIISTQKKLSTRIRTEERYLAKLKLQKKGLMHDLLTGKVRVKV